MAAQHAGAPGQETATGQGWWRGAARGVGRHVQAPGVPWSAGPRRWFHGRLPPPAIAAGLALERPAPLARNGRVVARCAKLSTYAPTCTLVSIKMSAASFGAPRTVGQRI